MRLVIVIIILIGHLLTIASWRCQTVWHEELAGGTVDAVLLESAHDHEHPEHPLGLFGSSSDHDHPEETPDHSHVPVPQSTTKITRVQLILAELVSLFAYAEMSRLHVPMFEVPSVQLAAKAIEPSLSIIPLSGSTTHLLF